MRVVKRKEKLNLLITGAAGYFASRYIQSVLRDPDNRHNMILIDDLTNAGRESVPQGAPFFQIGLNDRRKMTELFLDYQFDAVIHFAGYADGQNSFADPVYDAMKNVLGSLNLLEQCKEQQVPKFIYISTTDVYGLTHKAVTDSSWPHPISPHAASKFAIEQYLPIYQQNYDMDFWVLRFGSLYGYGQQKNDSVIASIMYQILTEKHVSLFGNDETKYDLLFIDDAIFAVNLALFTEQPHIFIGDRSLHVINIVSGESVSSTVLYQKIAQYMDCSIIPTYTESKHPIPSRDIDNNWARTILGWKPNVTLDDGILRTLEWIRQHAVKKEK